jgi:hypothetical protein
MVGIISKLIVTAGKLPATVEKPIVSLKKAIAARREFIVPDLWLNVAWSKFFSSEQ